MKTYEKIDRPPTAENWSRMQHPEVERTAKKIFSFLRGGPVWSYEAARRVTKYHVEDGITRDTALKIASKFGSSVGRSFNIELINAFFDYVEIHPIEGVRAFDDMVERFPLRRGVWIPIKPLTTIRQDGQFTPLFLCPWSEIAFDPYQASLFMTVLEKAVFTLTDFEDSVGKVLFFPKVKTAEKEWARKPVVWSRGQFPLLSESELRDQIRIFFESKELARLWYQDYLSSKEKK